MRFVYQYRTSDNVPHAGEIDAASREAAFAALKAQGIRPGRLDEAPGFFNKLFGKGKRWMAIALLSLLALGLAFAVYRGRIEAERKVNGELDRQQLLGDSQIIIRGITSDWMGVFRRHSDRFLARYAQPGVKVPDPEREELAAVVKELSATMGDAIPPAEGELDEIRQIKRIVAGIRAEMVEFVHDGGTVAQYVERLLQRQSYEFNLRERARREMSSIRSTKTQKEYETEWKRINLELRTFGMALIPLDAVDFESSEK